MSPAENTGKIMHNFGSKHWYPCLLQNYSPQICWSKIFGLYMWHVQMA